MAKPAYFERCEDVGRLRRNVPQGQGRRPEPMGIGESNLPYFRNNDEKSVLTLFR
ncbi:MAG: hypothetical protein K9M45_01905 [Kiritimatiellales bacterium]|nr:hypothetical protein [Kiritimatiellales bacterium]